MTLLVLVVDDEPDVEPLFRQQFRRELRTGQFMLEFATSANGAIDKIENATGATLILIFSDINMPEVSGLDLLPRLKTIRPAVPVIMITAYGDDLTRDRAISNGADALFTKPLDF